MCPINFVFMLCKVKKQAFSGYYMTFKHRNHSWSLVVTRGHSWSFVVTRGNSWSLVCTFRQDRCELSAELFESNSQ
jgi:hypothetical protein